jgi:hypothetical protein
MVVAVLPLAMIVTGSRTEVDAAEIPSMQTLSAEYSAKTLPLLKSFCLDCHSTEAMEGELDLERFHDLKSIRTNPQVWQKVLEMLDNGEMPPAKATQPTPDQKRQLRQWVVSYLEAEALAGAGDPGPVVLRRLSNAEYTYSIQDLTGVALQPAREFPVDGAAGEGFTNTGNALVMSPSLVTKYLDASREIAGHAVLLPDGIRFSEFSTRNDWTNATLDNIRSFYREFADHGGGDKVNLQGIVFDTNEGGRLPVERYIHATLVDRSALQNGTMSVETVAAAHGLNSRYLDLLWKQLHPTTATSPKPSERDSSPSASLLLDDLRAQWRSATPDDAAKLTERISRWQQALWRFTTVGHIGKLNGPKAWMEPVSPVTSRQEVRLPVPVAADGKDVVLYLGTGTAGDGNSQDFAVWERPRLVAKGRPDLLLKDVRAVTRELATHRLKMFQTVAACLNAASEAAKSQNPTDVPSLAARFQVQPETLTAWLQYLGIGTAGPVTLGTPLTGKTEALAGYDFVKGWVGDDALSVVANSSDQHVRVPGNMKPHSIAVHPTPTLSIGTGWRSPISDPVTIRGAVQHAHPECGNGVEWSLELRRGNTRQPLAKGISQGAAVVPFGPFENLPVLKGDVITLVISPRDGNHGCDLTAIDLSLQSAEHAWDLAADVSPDILTANPHADRQGHPAVWTFYSEPVGTSSGHVIPAGSLLAKWQAAGDLKIQQQVAQEIQQLLQSDTAPSADTPDGKLYAELRSLSGPLMSAALIAAAAGGSESSNAPDSHYGPDPAIFGRHPDGSAVEAGSMCVKAPHVLQVVIPADLAVGAEFVAAVSLQPAAGVPADQQQGSVQLQVSTTEPESLTSIQPTAVTAIAGSGPWTSNLRGVAWGTPVIVTDGSAARRRIEAAFDEFRQLFPAALCYTKIVPVDEVVTLTLFYREDDHLQRLMLNEQQTARLNQLWDELHFISRDALTLVDAFAQLMEYATQDADPKVFEPLRGPINERAAAFRQLQLDSEPKHVDAVVNFAEQAWRRPLSPQEAAGLRSLYQELRADELPHEDAVRTMISRILVSPAFLYRLENPAESANVSPVSSWELANRLSYFLWSSPPDRELREKAAAGTLCDPQVLKDQTNRMLKDDRVRRLSTEFACQWLHIYDFDQLDEKSERHFPSFASVRQPMYEEAIRFFQDLFQSDQSLLNIYQADYTFLNETLAQHYGIPGVTGPEWRRVDSVQQYGRGGILALGATLAKQSGASRTSPILRGNWLSEVLLGEKLPKPPKGVPVLPEDESSETLTVRQLVEKHTSDAKCSGCHQRIDPYGFSLEGYDAIGRARSQDLGGRAIDTKTRVMDGTELDGINGLRSYLLTQRRDAVMHQFCRKLLGYALGREVRLSDQPLLKNMLRKLQENEYHVTVAVEEIVSSPQFQKIRGRDAAAEVSQSEVPESN